jgi:acyl-coenzyme A thioesterase PaaI-like protein
MQAVRRSAFAWRRIANGSSTSALYAAAAAAATAAAAAAAAADQLPTESMSLQEWFEQGPLPGAEAVIHRFESDPNYVRIDKLFAEDRNDPSTGTGHAIFDSLGAKANAVHMYRIYCTADGSQTVAVATLMPGSDGHPGILHGGVTALLFDNTFGWANAVARLANAGELTETINGKPVNPDSTATFGFTAYLNTNYRVPCRIGSTLVLSCSVDRAEGRKLFLSGEARDAATGTLIADSKCLFVQPRR